jgi:short-subunit dehydrogenase
MDHYRPATLITGASAGIGMELARVFARNGHQLVLAARREDRLNALADEIAAKGKPRPLVLPINVALPDAPDRIAQALAAHGLEPEYVVNNAGFGLLGRAAALDRVEQLAMIDVNVRALTALSLAFIDSLKRRRGGLLNVASLAGFLPGPGMAVYYGTKAYVLSFSEALHQELAPEGVRVTVLCPGPVATEFQARAGVDPESVTWPLDVPAARVAEEAYVALIAGRRLVVPGLANKAVSLMSRFVPRSLLLAYVDSRQRRRGSPAAE